MGFVSSEQLSARYPADNLACTKYMELNEYGFTKKKVHRFQLLEARREKGFIANEKTDMVSNTAATGALAHQGTTSVLFMCF